MDKEYRETPFDELEWWFATFKQEKILGSPEETKIIQNTFGKQVIVFDPQNAEKALKKLTRDPTWGARLALVYHTVILRPGSRIGTPHQPRGMLQESFFRDIAATLPYMQNVKELILLDPDVHLSAATTHDLFEGANMQLETLWCDSEALLARCWSSFCKRVAGLQDFRGFCDPHQPPPSRIVPPKTPKLKYLETSVHFAFRLQVPWSITHLCIHVEWSRVPLILRKISNLPGLSDQLHSLRLNCYASPQPNPAKSGGANPRAQSSQALASMRLPPLVYRNLRAPVLNYLEIKEVTPVSSTSSSQSLQRTYARRPLVRHGKRNCARNRPQNPQSGNGSAISPTGGLASGLERGPR